MIDSVVIFRYQAQGPSAIDNPDLHRDVLLQSTLYDVSGAAVHEALFIEESDHPVATIDELHIPVEVVVEHVVDEVLHVPRQWSITDVTRRVLSLIHI